MGRGPPAMPACRCGRGVAGARPESTGRPCPDLPSPPHYSTRGGGERVTSFGFGAMRRARFVPSKRPEGSRRGIAFKGSPRGGRVTPPPLHPTKQFCPNWRLKNKRRGRRGGGSLGAHRPHSAAPSSSPGASTGTGAGWAGHPLSYLAMTLSVNATYQRGPFTLTSPPGSPSAA